MARQPAQQPASVPRPDTACRMMNSDVAAKNVPAIRCEYRCATRKTSASPWTPATAAHEVEGAALASLFRLGPPGAAGSGPGMPPRLVRLLAVARHDVAGRRGPVRQPVRGRVRGSSGRSAGMYWEMSSWVRVAADSSASSVSACSAVPAGSGGSAGSVGSVPDGRGKPALDRGKRAARRRPSGRRASARPACPARTADPAPAGWGASPACAAPRLPPGSAGTAPAAAARRPGAAPAWSAWRRPARPRRAASPASSPCRRRVRRAGLGRRLLRPRGRALGQGAPLTAAARVGGAPPRAGCGARPACRAGGACRAARAPRCSGGSSSAPSTVQPARSASTYAWRSSSRVVTPWLTTRTTASTNVHSACASASCRLAALTTRYSLRRRSTFTASRIRGPLNRCAASVARGPRQQPQLRVGVDQQGGRVGAAEQRVRQALAAGPGAEQRADVGVVGGRVDHDGLGVGERQRDREVGAGQPGAAARGRAGDQQRHRAAARSPRPRRAAAGTPRKPGSSAR